MAVKEAIGVLERGVDAWNAWREQDPDRRADFSGADLSGVNLVRANLRNANLSGANLTGANLIEATLDEANLTGANLFRAALMRASLYDADLPGAKLAEANLHNANLEQAGLERANLTRASLRRAQLFDTFLVEANLTGADLNEAIIRESRLINANLDGVSLSRAYLIGTDFAGADFSHVQLWDTVLANLDLSQTKGLDTCDHLGPSIIDHRTLQRSGQLPLSFLRGCGLPDNLIEYLPALFNQPIQFYSCFISYSSQDDEFAQRLHADLQNSGVRCWFAPHDLPIGARTRDTIDVAVRVRDKLLVILSANSIKSDWVEEEVETALEEERNSDNRRTILFPIRIDDAVFQTQRAWARKLRRERNIGGFTEWKNHDAYSKAFKRLLRDLKVEPAA
jgi:uncharacterized protein YjbI with pentapeptide repeats